MIDANDDTSEFVQILQKWESQEIGGCLTEGTADMYIPWQKDFHVQCMYEGPIRKVCG